MSSYPLGEHLKLNRVEHSLQVRVNARNMRSSNGVRKLAQPALGLPFKGVFAPDRLVPVACPNSDDDSGIFWHKDFCHCTAVHTLNRFGERHDDILANSEKAASVKVSAEMCHSTYSRCIITTGL